ncbi:immunoglobulin superfamily member 6 [Pseudophryne corroboree]|uniref:immunoglobulin superfamily member 6 n=1 Tax=Pseudophryne corroboree TaxID=495146 RepID=UPI00308210F5
MEPPGLRGFIFFTSILILDHYRVRSCKVTVQQDDFSEGYVPQKTVNVSCQYKKTENCPNAVQIYWFRYLASEHEELHPKVSNRRFTVHNAQNNTVLQIINISVQDSGIYICGIAFPDSELFTSKTTGPGSILQVREAHEAMITPANASLIVICTLLFIYSITVFSYYAFKSKWRICRFTESKQGFREKSYRARSVFQAIAKEYRNRCERKTNKQNQVIEDDTIYQNT